MKLTEKKNKAVRIFTPEGWLDRLTSPELDKQFDSVIASGVKKVVVDCHKLDYVSGSGIKVFCKAFQKLEKTSGTFILCALEDYVEEVLEMSGLDSVMLVEKSLSDALDRVINC